MVAQGRELFIVGPGRSGTSLLKAMLNRHPAIALAPETHFLDIWRPRLFAGDRFQPDRWHEFIASKHYRHFRRLGDESWIPGSGRELFDEMLTRFASAKDGVVRVRGEKTPSHCHHIDTLLRWYPDAVVLFCSRDPRGVVGSLTTVDEPWAERSVAAATRKWNQAVRAYVRHMGNSSVRLIAYEDLLADPRACLEGVLACLGLEWVDEVVHTEAGIGQLSNGSLRAESPLDASRVHAWKGRLSRLQIAVVETIARREMREMGYRLEATTRERALALPAAWFGIAAARARNAYRLSRSADARLRRRNAAKGML